MTARKNLALAGALALALAPACDHKGEATAEAHAHPEAGTIHLDAGAPQLKYLKIEVVGESGETAVLNLTGKVAFDENHTQRVASPIDGRATRVHVEQGDRVKAGQVLVELSSPSIGQLQADVRKAEQDVALTGKSLNRVRGLLDAGAVPGKELAQAEADHEKARADLASASARFGSMNLALGGGGAGIRAQVEGTVVERRVLVGQEVRADQAQPLLTVTDLSTVWVLGDLFEQDLGVVRAGSEVTVTVAAYPGATFPGKVTLVSDVVDPATRTLKLRCEVKNPELKLKPEMFARISLRDAGAKQLSVPVKAILSDTQPPHVVVVQGDRYFLRPVQVGPEVAGRARVFSGLENGERVVTDGAIFLKQEIVAQ